MNAILESDPFHYNGAIKRDENFKVVKVGNFEIGQLVSFETPVEICTEKIERFELPWVVVKTGRVEITNLFGWEVNPDYEQWAENVKAEYKKSLS